MNGSKAALHADDDLQIETPKMKRPHKLIYEKELFEKMQFAIYYPFFNYFLEHTILKLTTENQSLNSRKIMEAISKTHDNNQ